MKTLLLAASIVLAGVAAASAQSLTQTRWAFTQIGTDEIAAPDRGRAYLELDDKTGRAAMTAGCNRISGGFTQNGAALSFGRMAMTKMACHDEWARREDILLKILPDVRGWRLEKGVLLLTGADGGALARLAPAAR